jgi:hypothetical protein
MCEKNNPKSIHLESQYLMVISTMVDKIIDAYEYDINLEEIDTLIEVVKEDLFENTTLKEELKEIDTYKICIKRTYK